MLPSGCPDRDWHQGAFVAEQALHRSLGRRNDPAADLSQ
jgi:hypothetical protein